MFCNSCGTQLNNDDIFCPVCGSSQISAQNNAQQNNSQSDWQQPMNAQNDFFKQNMQWQQPNQQYQPQQGNSADMGYNQGAPENAPVHRKSKKKAIIIISAALLLVVAALVLFLVILPGSSSPTGTIKNLEKAIKNEDMDALLNCIDPDEHGTYNLLLKGVDKAVNYYGSYSSSYGYDYYYGSDMNEAMNIAKLLLSYDGDLFKLARLSGGDFDLSGLSLNVLNTQYKDNKNACTLTVEVRLNAYGRIQSQDIQVEMIKSGNKWYVSLLDTVFANVN